MHVKFLSMFIAGLVQFLGSLKDTNINGGGQSLAMGEATVYTHLQQRHVNADFKEANMNFSKLQKTG